MKPPIEEIASVLARFRDHVVAVGTEAAGKRFDWDCEIVKIQEWIEREATPPSSSPHEPEEKYMVPAEILTELQEFFPTREKMREAISRGIYEKANRNEFPGSVAVASELLAEMKAARDGAR